MKCMKSIFKIMVSIALGVMVAGCDKGTDGPNVNNGGINEGPQQVAAAVLSIDVNGIEESSAVVKAEIVSGSASAYKVLYNYPVADMKFDPVNERELIKFIQKNGVDVAELPLQETLVNLPHDVEYMSAIISYMDDVVNGSAYKVWTSEGGIWGDDTGAGNLPLNPWN